MRRRLRKKKHVGEFWEFGFSVKLFYDLPGSDPDRSGLIDEWLAMIEGCGLITGGCFSLGDAEQFVSRHRGMTVEADREAVSHWLATHPKIARWELGPLVDAWR